MVISDISKRTLVVDKLDHAIDIVKKELDDNIVIFNKVKNGYEVNLIRKVGDFYKLKVD